MTSDRFLELVRTCFDIACSSMDWGSGFLDEDEVLALRELAVHLGVDPWLATPPQARPSFCPGHQWTEWEDSRWHQGYISRRCSICGKDEQERIPWVTNVEHQRWASTSDTLVIPLTVTKVLESGLVIAKGDPDWRDPF